MKNRISNLLLVFMLGFTFTMYAQQKTVTGVITDAADGSVLPGATIIVKGTTTGVTSDFDGKYSITVNENDTLLITFMGYYDQEVSVQGKTIINIQLEVNKNL
ncbi:MAG: carboxypeptidase-like regulatory domain-containing protein, partial [Bacteroidota bacterium]